jgi:TRAP-type C4-dicarboxylate transport system permease small subunit
MRKVDVVINAVMKRINYVAAALLAIMVLFICVYVILRPFGIILFGTFELIQVVSMLVVAFSLGYNEYINGNVTVDLLDKLFKQRGQKVLKLFALSITFIICVATTYFSFTYIIDRYIALATTANLLIPIWIFAVILFFSFITLTISVLLKIVAVSVNYAWIGSTDVEVIDV